MGANSQGCVTERFDDATCILDDTHVSAYANVYTPDHTPANASTIYMHSRMFARLSRPHTTTHAHVPEHIHDVTDIPTRARTHTCTHGHMHIRTNTRTRSIVFVDVTLLQSVNVHSEGQLVILFNLYY